jgi:prephenate dehydratase
MCHVLFGVCACELNLASLSILTLHVMAARAGFDILNNSISEKSRFITRFIVMLCTREVELSQNHNLIF